MTQQTIRKTRVYYTGLREAYVSRQKEREEMDRALRGEPVERLYKKIYADLAVGVKTRYW